MFLSFIERVARPSHRQWTVTHHEIMGEKTPIVEPIPSELLPRVRQLIEAAGIHAVYSHQAEAIRLSLADKNVVLSTSTASGKTLAYQAVVMDRLVRDPGARGLFLFPLKALERDQRDAFLAMAGDAGLTAAVYDGDTPEWERRKIRARPPRVLITNPDMVHLGLLAYHDTWKEFFGNLGHVILDEVHTYKGIFGSHISQVLWRLRRVCALHGSSPRFFASSATIANPGEFVARLIGEPVEVVDRSGAPASTRHFLFLQPILSPYTVAARLFVDGLKSGLKTIVFTRARKITELITTWVINEAPDLRNRISSYRAGFLPEERRDIEARLFSGEMDGVISTSALEMGIDVGGLDLCILVGYPGTVINTWQRGGRVGRSGRPSGIILVGSNDALDQYFLKNPRDFFERSCEQAVLDPLNPEVLKLHLPCAAAEAPLREEEAWIGQSEVQAVLADLEKAGSMYRGHEDAAWYSYKKRPHRDVDLRGIGAAFPIFLADGKTLVGSSSGIRALTECHEGAVYLHRATQYLVTKLDLERQNVLVKPTRLNYYTRALSEKDTEILGAPLDTREFLGFVAREGRLKVTERIVAYEKRRSSGQELIGTVELDLPPVHFETVGIWIEIPDIVKQNVQAAGFNFMGGIHALEHAAIAMFPLFALCDRDDIGGISTPHHEQVCRAAIFIYDGHPGGVGLSHHIFGRMQELLEKTRSLIQGCPCEEGCPSCIHSPKCGNGNKPLDKKAALLVLDHLLEPEKAMLEKKTPPRKKAIGDLPLPAPSPYPLPQGEGIKQSSPSPCPLPQGERVLKPSLLAGEGGERGKSHPCDQAEGSRSSAPREAPSPFPLPLKEERDSKTDRATTDVWTSPLSAPQKPSPLAGEGRVRGNSPSLSPSPQIPSPPKGGRGQGEGEKSQPSHQDLNALLAPPTPSPYPLPQGEGANDAPRRIVVFDLETQKVAEEVGGWGNIARMKVSLAVAYTEEDGFRTFTEAKVPELIDLLKSADLVVGFNQIRFDYEVLSAYTREDLRALPNLDILADIAEVLGFRLALDHLAQSTLGRKKTGMGLEAVLWFREGRMDLLEQYCCEDVRITRDLYQFGLENGFLLYRRKGGQVARIPVEWADAEARLATGPKRGSHRG